MALTVGVATVLESREVVVVVTGLRKSLALSKAIGASYISFLVVDCPLNICDVLTVRCGSEEGVNHLVRFSVSVPFSHCN